METIISFFKRRWWSFAPLLLCVCVFLISWWLRFSPNFHEDSISVSIGGFALLLIPGTVALLFTRKEVIKAWSLFAVLYFIITLVFLSTQNAYGWISPRGMYGVWLSASLSVITIFWSIIHTLILRRQDKKNENVKV